MGPHNPLVRIVEGLPLKFLPKLVGHKILLTIYAIIEQSPPNRMMPIVFIVLGLHSQIRRIVPPYESNQSDLLL